MVRRAAGTSLGVIYIPLFSNLLQKFALLLSKDIVKEEFFPVFLKLAEDEQDSVRYAFAVPAD